MIYDALQLQNALDSNNYLLISPANLMPLALPPGFQSIQSDIEEQLSLAYTEHQFSSNFMHSQLDFLEGKIFSGGFE